MEAHMMIHTKDSCQFCNEKFTVKILLRRHIQKHLKRSKLSENLPEFTCKICFKVCKDENHFKRHSKVHSRTFKCHVCTLELRKELYGKHMKSHIDTKCKICGLVLKDVENLRGHLRTHDKENNYTLKCDRCPWYRTDRKNVFKYHLNMHEREDKKAESWPNKVWCEKCKKYLRDEKSFEYHQKYVHAEVKYECDVCGRREARKDVMKKHLEKLHFYMVSK